MKKFLGVKEIKKKSIYEVNFRPYRKAKRVFRRIKAVGMQEAYRKRAELIAGAAGDSSGAGDKRDILNFDAILPALERNLLADSLPLKTKLRYRKIYNRIFTDFRLARFPNVKAPRQLNLTFFIEYKEYFVNDLGRPKGLRAELIILKAIMHRLYKLGYCPEAVIKELKELKKPPAVKKEYPDISREKMREFMRQVKTERSDLYGPVYFMMRTGRRVEETTLIERKDVVWDGINPKEINIRAETTKTKRYAPLKKLDDDLRSLIRNSYQESKQHKPPFLFLSRKYKKCGQRKITEFLGSLSEKMLGVRITAHYFRHRFFTECGKANIPQVDVMEISGLRDAGVLQKYYSHTTNEGQLKVLEITRL